MSKYTVKRYSPKELKTYSLHSRESKVKISSFAKSFESGMPVSEFIDNLPDILAGSDFKRFVKLMVKAKALKKPILLGLGAHVVKLGLSPVIINLMQEGWVSALALNGAGIIHDFEVAFAGHTSEDVGSQVKNGRFGVAKETGEILNEAVNSGAGKMGLGECVGKMISSSSFPYKEFSLLSAAYDLNIPVTVHVALGTDTVHFHPTVDGAALGRASLDDFFLFCSLLEKVEGGGIFINFGSAVMLPEVFLKALAFLRNQGMVIEDFSTAVFDFIHHYRPYQNVVKRPFQEKGEGFYFIGHLEIMIPLLAASLLKKKD